MCRNITILRGLQPPATAEEIEAAARQYVRKVSGATKPPAGAEAVFEQAIAAVAAATTTLLAGATGPPPAAAQAAAAATPRSLSPWGVAHRRRSAPVTVSGSGTRPATYGRRARRWSRPPRRRCRDARGLGPWGNR